MRFNRVSMCVLTGVAVVGGETAMATGPRIMAIGDSITYGLTGTTGNYVDMPGGYRTNFYNTMTLDNLSYKAVGASTANPSPVLTAAGETAHNGYGGWTVGSDVYDAMNNFMYHVDDWMQTSNPDEVLLLGGINDLLLGASVSKTTNNMDLLLGKIFTDKPTVKLYVSNLLPNTGAQAGNNSNVIAFNNALQNTLIPKYQSQGRSIYLVDQYSNFTVGGVPSGANLPDGLHPNQTGYNLMGATFANAVATYAPKAPPRATPVAIDIGGAGAGNNVKGTIPSGAIKYNSTWTNSLSDMVAKDGNATDYGFQWISYTNVAYMGSIAAGSLTGQAAADFPDDVARSFWGSPAGNSLNFKLTGLIPGTAYVIELFAGHQGGTDTTRFTLVGNNTLAGNLQAGNNYGNVLSLSGILPNAAGEITVSATGLTGSDTPYLNAFQINEVPEPASLSVLALGATMLLRRHRRSARMAQG